MEPAECVAAKDVKLFSPINIKLVPGWAGPGFIAFLFQFSSLNIKADQAGLCSDQTEYKPTAEKIKKHLLVL